VATPAETEEDEAIPAAMRDGKWWWPTEVEDEVAMPAETEEEVAMPAETEEEVAIPAEANDE